MCFTVSEVSGKIESYKVVRVQPEAGSMWRGDAVMTSDIQSISKILHIQKYMGND